MGDLKDIGALIGGMLVFVSGATVAVRWLISEHFKLQEQLDKAKETAVQGQISQVNSAVNSLKDITRNHGMKMDEHSQRLLLLENKMESIVGEASDRMRTLGDWASKITEFLGRDGDKSTAFKIAKDLYIVKKKQDG